MKRIIGIMLTLCMLLQTSAFVFAEEDENVLFDFGLEDRPAGALNEYTKGVSDNGIVTVCEDPVTDKKFIDVKDNDTVGQVGVLTANMPMSGKTTTTFKFKQCSDTFQNFGPQIYIHGTGTNLTLVLNGTLNSGVYYYTNKEYIHTGYMVPKNQMVDVTLIVDGSGGVFTLYIDGTLVIDKANLRDDSKITGNGSLYIGGPTTNKSLVHFELYDFKTVDGEHVPSISEDAPNLLNPERTLVDFSDAKARLDALLGNAVAMTIGNSVARVNNEYVNIDPDEVYVAPFITADGYTLIPTRFTTETIGCSVEVLSSTSFRFSKDGTTMEINMGDKNAIINGVAKEMPTTPQIKYDRLFIPLRFAAETFGKNVFWDDRGLIVISDTPVVKAGQEDIIKPLINDIRQKTSLNGNEKYSDVAFSVREVRPDGHMNGADTPQLGSIDASKRFMATRNWWSYVNTGDKNKTLRDLGYLTQGSLNGQFRDYETMEQSVINFDGTPTYRSDGLGKTSFGSNWGCVCDPAYYQNIMMRGKAAIDNGIIAFQFDDWQTNKGYINWANSRGCYCDHSMKEFTNYLINVADKDTVAKTGITDLANFNYKKYLQDLGITTNVDTTTKGNSTLRSLFTSFNSWAVKQFHAKVKADLEAYAGCELLYSVNASSTLGTYAGSDDSSFINDVATGKMGETKGSYTTAPAVYALMLFSRATGIKETISPLPHSETDKINYYAGTAMCYASGLQMLIAWDDYLSISKRYYATLEELDHVTELPREYPFLFDNYEIPEHIGYVYDLDTFTGILGAGNDMLTKSIPGRVIVSQNGSSKFEIESKNAKGLQAVIVDPKTLAELPEKERAALEASGVPVVTTDDTATVNWLENTFWMVHDNNADVATVLRQNKLYDNAPTIVHAVNYNKVVQDKVEIEVNNLYLPEGDTFNVNVYVPGKNYETIKVKKGEGSTKINLSNLKRWAVLEICGPTTVRREVKFDLGEGINGIGLGSRVSNDKAYGTVNNFTMVTYGEGLNSTTFGDLTGCQDEAAFVYKRFGAGKVRTANVSAGFESADGTYGVMVREGIYSNARYIALMYDAENGLRLARRLVANKGTLYESLGKDKPKYMKLERDGSTYKAYVSDDGVKYKQVASAKMDLSEAVGGVFATSPNGSRAECKVVDFKADPGSFGNENFVRFKVSYADGKLDRYTYGEKLDVVIDTDNYKGVGIEDVNVKFTSSDENIVRVSEDGTLTPTGVGTATINATASMGMKRISSSCSVTITPADVVMWSEDFEGGTLPSYMKPDNPALTVVDGVYTALTETNAVESNTTFSIPLRKLPTVYEFDFRAHFGTASPTTGVRVLYANGTAISFTASKTGFHWFFGGSQTYVAPIKEDKWYHIKIEIDYDTNKANVYIDGEKVVEDAEGRSGFSTNGAMQVGGWRLGTDSKYEWDNFKVYFFDFNFT